MSEAGFLEQKQGSPTGFALVVIAHVAALGALALAKGPQFILPDSGPIVIDSIRLRPPPPPEPTRDEPRPQQPSTMTVAPTPTPLPLPFPTAEPTPLPPRPEALPGPNYAEAFRPEVPTPTIRREAQLISGDLQPPYPASEERAQRGGSVRLRVSIGPNGRVTAVERISATNDAFWRVTERQAMTRWRFRPATEDGRPVAASRVMTVTFRIEDL